jgi:hypothetical protein
LDDTLSLKYYLNMKIFVVAAVVLLIAQSRIMHKHDSIVSAAGNDPVLNSPFSSSLARLVNQGGNSLSTSSVSNWSGSQVGRPYPGQAYPAQIPAPGFQNPIPYFFAAEARKL